jgi:hypothetical protein
MCGEMECLEVVKKLLELKEGRACANAMDLIGTPLQVAIPLLSVCLKSIFISFLT